jgi:death-on-curing family protein
MTKKLYKTPSKWLTLDVCTSSFQEFAKNLIFGQPIPPFDTRFAHHLESILGSVKATYFGKYLNPTVLDAASAYFNQLVRGHSFRNGNKRIAILYTHIFLLMHGIDYTLTYGEMYHFAVAIAQAGEKGIKADETKRLCRKIIEKYTTDAKKI